MCTMTKVLKLSFIYAYLICMWHLPVVHMAIRSRSGTAANSLYAETLVAQSAEKMSSSTPGTVIENTDLMDKLSWQCANNASCLYSIVNNILNSYKRGEAIKLGLFDLVKLPSLSIESARKMKQKWNEGLSATLGESGRAISMVMDFISGNALRIPVGPMVFSVQRAEDDSNYIEVALLKKSTARQGRLQGNGGGRGSGTGGSGGLLYDGDGGSGNLGKGGGGGLHGGSHHRMGKGHHDRKQFQMYIPMYLAATTFGWTMMAVKAVGLLTLKALLISKVAFVVAAIVLIKKFMDNASEKMMYQFPDHSPYMVPYGMDYALHGAEIPSDMYPAALQFAAAGAGVGGNTLPGHPALENLAAESNVHPSVSDIHNNTQILAALNAVGLGHKVKREDSWIAKTRRPLIYRYMQPHLPLYRV